MALLKETDIESLTEAKEMVKSMKYASKQADIIATALRNKYVPLTIKEALKNAGYSEDEIEVTEVKEDDSVLSNSDDDNVRFKIEEDHINDDNVKFKNGEEYIKLDKNLKSGKTYIIRIGDDVLTLRLDEVNELNNGKNRLDYEDDLNEFNNGNYKEDRFNKEDNIIMSRINRQKRLAQLNDRNLGGEDASRPSAKKMRLNGPMNVGAPGEKGKSMRLLGSENNSLREQNPEDLLGFEVPTSALDNRFLNHAVKSKMALEGAGGKLVDEFNNLNLADMSIPELDGNEGMFGEDKTMLEFEVPTEMLNQRKITVAKQRRRRNAALKRFSKLGDEKDNERDDEDKDKESSYFDDNLYDDEDLNEPFAANLDDNLYDDDELGRDLNSDLYDEKPGNEMEKSNKRDPRRRPQPAFEYALADSRDALTAYADDPIYVVDEYRNRYKDKDKDEDEDEDEDEDRDRYRSVSYTHLTLPTIYSV